jgi:hypothetical protein
MKTRSSVALKPFEQSTRPHRWTIASNLGPLKPRTVCVIFSLTTLERARRNSTNGRVRCPTRTRTAYSVLRDALPCSGDGVRASGWKGSSETSAPGKVSCSTAQDLSTSNVRWHDPPRSPGQTGLPVRHEIQGPTTVPKGSSPPSPHPHQMGEFTPSGRNQTGPDTSLGADECDHLRAGCCSRIPSGPAQEMGRRLGGRTVEILSVLSTVERWSRSHYGHVDFAFPWIGLDGTSHWKLSAGLCNIILLPDRLSIGPLPKVVSRHGVTDCK